MEGLGHGWTAHVEQENVAGAGIGEGKEAGARGASGTTGRRADNFIGRQHMKSWELPCVYSAGLGCAIIPMACAYPSQSASRRPLKPERANVCVWVRFCPITDLLPWHAIGLRCVALHQTRRRREERRGEERRAASIVRYALHISALRSAEQDERGASHRAIFCLLSQSRLIPSPERLLGPPCLELDTDTSFP